MLVLNAGDVEACIDIERAIEASATALAMLVEGRAEVPVRHHIGLGHDDPSVALFMPGFLPDLGVLGLKIATLVGANPGRGLPTTPCVMGLIDPATGFFAALMESTWLTNVKTGGGTGVATNLLARGDAAIYAVLGAGSIAYHQVEGVLAVRPSISRVVLWNRTRARADTLCARLRADFGDRAAFEVSDDAATAVSSADIVTACTSASEPVVLGAWVEPGTHVNLVGAHGAEMREGDDALLAKTSIAAVDKIEGARVSGDVAMAIAAGVRDEDGFVDVGRIVLGNERARDSNDEITWYKSVGNAAQDLVTAKYVLDEARKQGLGQTIELNPAETGA